MTNNQKIAMTAGWAAAGFLWLAVVGMSKELIALRETNRNQDMMLRIAEPIVTEALFQQIIDSNDL
jgi:arginine exporter protein ArgO